MTIVLTAAVGLIVARGRSEPASSASTPASAINLRTADVPGFSVTRRPAKGYSPLGSDMERCDSGPGNAKEDIGIESQMFENRDYGETSQPTIATRFHPLWEVQSAVYVTRNAALATRRVRIAGSVRARDCLKRLIAAGIGKAVGSDSANEPSPKVEVSALPSPLPSVPFYGLRSTFCFGFFLFAPCDAAIIHDYLGFAAGPALITLDDTGTPRVFPSTTERRLLTLLYKRARARKP